MKSQVIVIRVTRQQKERIIELSKLHGLNLSEYMIFKSLESDISQQSGIDETVKRDYIRQLNPLRKIFK